MRPARPRREPPLGHRRPTLNWGAVADRQVWYAQPRESILSSDRRGRRCRKDGKAQPPALAKGRRVATHERPPDNIERLHGFGRNAKRLNCYGHAEPCP